jgi:murein DD-endopeptidase MepM/ murein hydrolase activator NlpD
MRPPSRAALALLAAAMGATAAAQAQAYPALSSLGPDDVISIQRQELLEQSYAAIRSGSKPPDLVFYTYTVGVAIDLFSLAARLDLPYETLATVNRLDRARSFLPGERLLAPSAPGIFASRTPGSDLDLLLSYREKDSGYPVTVRAGGEESVLLFYPGAGFSPEERALFLGRLFRFPLPTGVLSSGFGMREKPSAHRAARWEGIDLAAPMGTEVYAAREGRVAEAGVDPVLGQYIVIRHDGGWSTVYGHLSTRRVRLNDEVESGMIVGNVGSTGETAGPRLHFEVRVVQEDQ